MLLDLLEETIRAWMTDGKDKRNTTDIEYKMVFVGDDEESSIRGFFSFVL